MRFFMSSILNGIYLFQCISLSRAVSAALSGALWLQASWTIVFVGVLLASCTLSTRNEFPAGVISIIHYVHALLGSMGFISPFAFSLCVAQYTPQMILCMSRPLTPSVSSVFMDLLVSITLEYVCSLTVLKLPIISFTSFLVWSLSSPIIGPSRPEPRELNDKCINTIGSKFVLRPAQSVEQVKAIYFFPSSDHPEEWQYIDLHNTVQGPFKNDQMADWYKAGFLKDDLHVSPAYQYTFRTIREQFQGVLPFE